MLQAKGKFPPWIKKRLPASPVADLTRRILEQYDLNTVCRSAHCPNIGECFARGTATFMIMGNVCTRSCRFCAVKTGKPSPPEDSEPERISLAAKEMGLRHVVVTSVTRDDLEDGGAAHFAAVIRALRKHNPQASVEVLVPDFKGSEDSVRIVVDAQPDVFNHNVETVLSLYTTVRPEAGYRTSLGVLALAKKLRTDMLTKSGLMLGLGERHEEVEAVLYDLRRADCDIVTIGQYLRPSPEHLPVVEFVEPAEFERYLGLCKQMGFRAVASGPFVRSSYNAIEVKDEAQRP
ncbi:lipoyl synthase [Candidatus Poribacteria bacterium]|nr:lipoyl synthase [Candidatus Poribacteria bacterium]